MLTRYSLRRSLPLLFGLMGVPVLFGVLSAVLGRKAGALGTGLIGGGLARAGAGPAVFSCRG